MNAPSQEDPAARPIAGDLADGYVAPPQPRPVLRVAEVMVQEGYSSAPVVGPLRVRLESPDALFVPDHRIQLPVPAPLYLLSCLRLPLETAYPMTEGGVVAR